MLKKKQKTNKSPMKEVIGMEKKRTKQSTKERPCVWLKKPRIMSFFT
jgi:hypothetical protein